VIGMEMDTIDYLKKALLDSQERVRDFKNYSDKVEDDELKDLLLQCSETAGKQASKIKEYIDTKFN
jgi:hypothetical protein